MQDVWSVRKNIHHGFQNQKNKLGGATLAPIQYSRHGAIPPKATDSSEKDYNVGDKYSEAAKRPIESPNSGLAAPPQPKRKNIADIIRPTVELPPLVKTKDNNDSKKNYAKKMMDSHLRSVGMGEFTPKQDSYHLDTNNKSTTKWKRKDSDEFDFET